MMRLIKDVFCLPLSTMYSDSHLLDVKLVCLVTILLFYHSTNIYCHFICKFYKVLNKLETCASSNRFTTITNANIIIMMWYCSKMMLQEHLYRNVTLCDHDDNIYSKCTNHSSVYWL